MHKRILLALDGSEQSLTAGIARDIINESYHDYSVLVIGRNGMAGFVDCKLKLPATAGKSGRGIFIYVPVSRKA